VRFDLQRLPESVGGLSSFAAAVLGSRVAFEHVTVALDAGVIAAPRDAFLAEDRELLAQALERNLAPLAPHVAVLDSVRALRKPNACCVVTGQQPALLVSPLFALYKALHAIRLARSLSQAWELPVVPVFWNHADDHDVAEVHHTWLLNENLDLQRVGLAGMSSGRIPLSRLQLTEDKQHLSAMRELLRQTLGRHEHAEDAIELLLARDGDTFASTFTRAMTQLLGHLGLVVVEPDWIRERLSRSLASVVTAPLASALAAGDAALRAAGLEPAIDSSTAALVFRVDDDGRHGLRLGGDGFRYDNEAGSRTASELAAEIVQDVTAWSPGALLRPIVQDSSLPVAAYVGGWGELDYHVQLGALRRALGMPRAFVVPRWSCTLVDPQTYSALAQLDLPLAAVLAARGRIEQDDAGESAPPVVAELRGIAERASNELLAQKGALAELDRGLAQNLGRTASQIRSLVEKMCEKAERVHANNQGRGKRVVRRVANTICPRGELQERVLGPLPYLAQFGRGWIDELFEQVGPFERAHLVASWIEDKEPREDADAEHDGGDER
jgi:bacillithiol biosynthesis cysteine-adding enzyme BshC